MKILGVDLGTSNTYIYAIRKFDSSGFIHEEPQPVIITPISDDTGSIATVVLYENGQPIAIGNIAEGEFYTNRAKRFKRELATQFKPEISSGAEKPMRWMSDFLGILRKNLPEGIIEEDTLLYVGMPALAKEDFILNLGQCFTAAGWPRPAFIRESDAALVSCLQSGVIGIEDMEQRCLIMDFGGGTFDFSIVSGLDSLQNGGDFLYGGRLFDDLIFQEFCSENDSLAFEIAASPTAWHTHWVECREQKEAFSNFLNANAGEDASYTLHIAWIDSKGEKRDEFIRGYTKDRFIRNAENYAPTPAMLEILDFYRHKGGISSMGRDLLEGREVGLIDWLRRILESVHEKLEIAKIILTGGSCRWFFVAELCGRVFPKSRCIASARGFEDIAYGLTLFPILLKSRERTAKALTEKLPEFARKAVQNTRELIQNQIERAISMCADRIIERDMMPALEEAQRTPKTIGELEKEFADNIKSDAGLLEIAREKSEILHRQIQDELQREFRAWLRSNGVVLIPRFSFPAREISEEFFSDLSIKLNDLDVIKITRIALVAILPIIAGATAAHFLAPLGEPVSLTIGIGLTGTAAWLAAKTAPDFIANRKLPAFLLTEANRKRIIEKNHLYIKKALNKEFGEVSDRITREVDERIRQSLKNMLDKLTILNQIRTM